MTFDDIVASYGKLDAEHDTLKSRIVEIEAEKEVLQSQALQKLTDLGADKVRSGRYDVERKDMRAYKATSWQDFYDWIHADRRFDCLHKAISVTTLDDVAESGGLPPGIEKIEWQKANFKKVSKVR
jgi:hypothetical protein